MPLKHKQALARREAKAFVERSFGRGQATVIATTNPATFEKFSGEKVGHKDTRISVKDRFLALFGRKQKKIIPTVFPEGIHFRRGKKHMVFSRSYKVEDWIHEKTHAAYVRYRDEQGKEIRPLVSETLSYLLELEYLKQNNPKKLEKVLRMWTPQIENFKSQLEHNIKSEGGESLMGMAMATLVFKSKLNNLSQDRRAGVRAKLMDLEIKTPKELFNWAFKVSM